VTQPCIIIEVKRIKIEGRHPMANQELVDRLKQGVEGWNLWRKEFQGILNLSEANLSGAFIRRADLRRADLRYANLREANLTCKTREYGVGLLRKI
jgi:uncharacterized protein YjbI with pentapeptide repeats